MCHFLKILYATMKKSSKPIIGFEDFFAHQDKYNTKECFVKLKAVRKLKIF